MLKNYQQTCLNNVNGRNVSNLTLINHFKQLFLFIEVKLRLKNDVLLSDFDNGY